MIDSVFTMPRTFFPELEQLQQEMSRLFGNMGMPADIRSVGLGAFPAINIGTTPEAVEVYALAPGVDPRSLEISFEKGVLTVAGERPNDLPAEDDKVQVFKRERYAGAFRRVISLTEDVDPEKVHTTYRDGILRITAPKRTATRSRKIEVK